MSIASEITRLQQAKADIKAAIENKGVTVPSDATLDAYDGYIDDIPSGGGGNWETIAKGMIDGTITSLTIPDNVTNIRRNAFYYLDSLESVNLSNTQTINTYSFQHTGLTSLYIPNTVTYINQYSFGYTKLTSLIFEEGGETLGLGMRAFGDITTLRSVVLPNRVKNIARYLFAACTGLTEVTIGNAVTSIGDNVFTGCTSLTDIVINTATPPTLNVHAFDGASALTNIYVPDASVSAYQSATNWTSHASKIKGISERPTT